ncbi:hypothetical protein E8E11_004983 [Didymella keratinophila]|nr:hypothetical protein E8E11_004983 [Didymella keratinophila]
MTAPVSAPELVELDDLANDPFLPSVGSPFIALPETQLHERLGVPTLSLTPAEGQHMTPASTAATVPETRRDIDQVALPTTHPVSSANSAAMSMAANAAPTSGYPDPSSVEKAGSNRKGYLRFSSWMASDDDFFVVRRFQSLNAHTILYMQNRLARIEERLWQLEKREPEPNAEIINDSFEWDSIHLPERQKLLQQLTGLLHHYNGYIDTYTRIRDRPPAERYQITNLQQQMKAGMICNRETGFAENKNDLISISPKRYSSAEAIMRSNQRIGKLFLRFRPTRRHTWVEPMSSRSRGEIFPPSELTGTIFRLSYMCVGIAHFLLVCLFPLDSRVGASPFIGVEPWLVVPKHFGIETDKDRRNAGMHMQNTPQHAKTIVRPKPTRYAIVKPIPTKHHVRTTLNGKIRRKKNKNVSLVEAVHKK